MHLPKECLATKRLSLALFRVTGHSHGGVVGAIRPPWVRICVPHASAPQAWRRYWGRAAEDVPALQDAEYSHNPYGSGTETKMAWVREALKQPEQSPQEQLKDITVCLLEDDKINPFKGAGRLWGVLFVRYSSRTAWPTGTPSKARGSSKGRQEW